MYSKTTKEKKNVYDSIRYMNRINQNECNVNQQKQEKNIRNNNRIKKLKSPAG